MSGLELNKIVGAVLTAALFFVVIGFIGDALVNPKAHKAASMTVTASKAPAAAPKKAEPLPPITPLLASADVAAGKKSANKCKACHDLTSAQKKKVGPPLWNIVDAGKHTGSFSYSKGMMAMGGKWSYEDLNKFLANPKAFVKGTKMVFRGVKKAKERANLIAFLRSLSDSPKPMP
ncbi:MAG: c-type cytochrome [Rhodospirillaceae bacterium]|jgi:cytochrome c|nr:c-type cytochrome [Rhodospirillaceae bacterium]MBT5049625.1 c-type cytochrome [Rhodospirillaceae bacterium]MBT5457735.1 c-type cytochrome [Rhodospirillaceae bacterium]